jgi:hypothetical protein
MVSVNKRKQIRLFIVLSPLVEAVYFRIYGKSLMWFSRLPKHAFKIGETIIAPLGISYQIYSNAKFALAHYTENW